MDGETVTVASTETAKKARIIRGPIAADVRDSADAWGGIDAVALVRATKSGKKKELRSQREWSFHKNERENRERQKEGRAKADHSMDPRGESRSNRL